VDTTIEEEERKKKWKPIEEGPEGPQLGR